MDQPTKDQVRTLKQYVKTYRGWDAFTCPQCSEEQPVPTIENPGEDQTQINCRYGCGYMFLDNNPKTK